MVRPRRFRGRVQGFIAALILVAAPQIARAQEAPIASDVSDLLPIVIADKVPSNVALSIVAAAPLEAASSISRSERWQTRFTAWRKDAGVLFPLYSGFVGAQILDVDSTRRALAHGSSEANGLIAPISNHPGALLLVKGAATTTTVYLLEKHVRQQHRKAAIVTMIGLNAVYALIAVNNYRYAH